MAEMIEQCPKCGCRDLFVRKDFPQRLGLAIVFVAGIAFLVLAARRNQFYLGAIVLIVALLIDALGYFLVGLVTVCYRCRGEFRDVPINPAHGPFELSIAEKYRGAPPPQLHG
jgi:ABC-type dipeptide/oligopeptide/nickel transport system permease component